VAAARRLPVPDAAGLTLKAPADFRLLGTSPPRVDGPDIVTGRARYGIDASLPGMLYASFERCPVIGGRVESFDARRALAVPGVRGVYPVDGSGVSWMLQWARGVAVVAQSSWAALAGREALEVVWDEGPNAGLDQGEILADLAAACSEPGTITRRDGDVAAALAGGETITADYVAPYLSHSPVEPMNCVVDARADRCRILAPVQFPHVARDLAAKALGLDPARVEVEPTLVGGGFGRRIYADYVGEAALISKAAGAPVQLLWTRQDDTRHGFYRPLSHHRLAARLDGAGGVLAWHHRIAGPSRDAASGPDVETPERSEVYGVNEMPYAIPHVQVEFRHRYVPLPCGPWRSVAYSQAGQVIEGFVDELAHAAGADPVAFRRRLLAAAAATAADDGSRVHPSRLVAVLDLAAERAGWGRPLPAGRGRGVAVTGDHGSCVAHVAEVSVAGGAIRVERMVSAVDCGQLVHRDMAVAQVEGAVALALSAALKSEITLRRGRVEQGSYADYDVVRMGEMPEVEVHFVPSVRHPTGLGEPPLPGVAPAVLNAVFAATGRRLRRIPVARLG
jgi:isoquinoline 1-oxidoreductase beta subunit